MLTCKTISANEDILEFSKQYHLISGNIITTDELKRRSCVDAFFDSNGRMRAGYTVNCEHPLVYLSDLPQDIRMHDLYDSGDDIVEGGSIWVEDTLSDFERGYVFIYASWRVFSMKKKYFMGGARNPKVAQRQKFIFRNILFEGRSDKFEYLCILYCGRKYILLQISLFILRYWIIQPVKKWLTGLKLSLDQIS